LSVIFIFGIGPFPALGVRAVAVAMTVSIITELFILLIATYFFRYPPAGKIREMLSFTAVFAGRYFRIALPVVINYSALALGISNKYLIMARHGTESVAAYNIAGTIFNLTWVVFTGLSSGIGVLVGKKIGEGDWQEARNHIYKITRFMPLLSVVIIALMLPLSRIMFLVLAVSPEVIKTAAMMVTMYCIFYPFMAFNISVIIGACRSGGDTVYSALNDLLPLWLVSLPLGVLACFVFRLPAHVIMFFMITEEIFKTIIGMFRLKSGKWLRSIVSN